MKGVIVEAAGGPWKVVENLEVPKPAPDQILVKSIATAINPVYALCFIPLYSASIPMYRMAVLANSFANSISFTVIHICNPVVFW